VTEEYATGRPLSELYTGQGNAKRTRTYARYLENADIKVWEEFYDGNDIVHHFRNPYPGSVPVDGTDGFQFSPKLVPEDQIKLFDEFAMRPVNFAFDSKSEHGNVEISKYKLDVENFANRALYSDNFDCPILNVSSIYETPLIVALPQFAGCKKFCY